MVFNHDVHETIDTSKESWCRQVDDQLAQRISKTLSSEGCPDQH